MSRSQTDAAWREDLPPVGRVRWELEGDSIAPHDYVKWVQRSLNRALGLRFEVNGVASSAGYRRAVTLFQSGWCPPVTGTVDGRTQNALILANERDPAYVRWVRRALNAAGAVPKLDELDASKASAIGALKKFQSHYGLGPDGFVGAKTELALIRAAASLPPERRAPAPPRGRPQPLRLIEPDPDVESGVQALGLGDDLGMRLFEQHLFVGEPSIHEPIQGLLGNCPLPAILCAMAHVPAQRQRLRDTIVSELAIDVGSQRQRKAWEFFTNDQPRRLPRVPATGVFESPRLLTVRFRSEFPEASASRGAVHRLPRAERDRQKRLWETIVTHPSIVPSSPVLFVDLAAGGVVHYMRAASGALWPSIIEKAYAIARGRLSYQGINNDVGLAECMRHMTGAAEEEHLVAGPRALGELPPITTVRLRARLKQHHKRPTILGSRSSPNRKDVVGNHTFAVVDFDGSRVQLINALEEQPADRTLSVPVSELRDNFGEIVQGPA